MTVGIVGLGLIGGSIGLALRDPDRVLIGYEPNPANAKVAIERFCVDRVANLEEVAEADVIFVAVPPANLESTLNYLADHKRPDTVLTDCTSVKEAAVNWALRTQEMQFVPGHPMAGHEKNGPSYASAWLFRGARWLLTPLPQTELKAVRQVSDLVRTMGAVPILMGAEEHDRNVAIVSHLPHAFAGVLVQMAESIRPNELSGGSWKDLTRVGGVDPQLWTQIFLGNAGQLKHILRESSTQLSALADSLEANDEHAIRAFFEQALRAKVLSDEPVKLPENQKKRR